MKIDLTGQKFGRLTVLEESPERTKWGSTRWLCQCDCGRKHTVVGGSLRSGLSRSCGCLFKEIHTKHGDSNHQNGKRTRLYVTWLAMKQRCYNEKTPAFRWYGAKGIKVCKAWKNSYETFKSWALTHGYSDTLTIDRIKPRRDYCSANCQWIPARKNAQRAVKYRWAKQRHFERLSERLCLN